MENKEEVIKKLEYIFEPIGGKFISFEIPFAIYSSIHPIGSYADIFLEKNKITTYPVIINTNHGELRLGLHSDNLNNLKHAIGIAYSYSGFNTKNENIELEIQKRIYSE